MSGSGSFRVLDLFAGIGGFALAARALGGEVVGSVELDRQACRVYSANHHEVVPTDIADYYDPPEHDLLCAGFPCQAFSMALRSRVAPDDSRLTMWGHVRRLLVHQPGGFLLENVPGLRSYGDGVMLDGMLRHLEWSGYRVDHALVDAHHWVPQARRRLYIVGVRRDLSDLPPLVPVGPEGLPTPPSVWEVLAGGDVPEHQLSDRMWECARRHRARHQAAGNGHGYRLLTRDDRCAPTLTAHYAKDGFGCLIPQRAGNPRRLTPDEFAWLMGFPSDYDWAGASRSARYRLLGNAVVPAMTAWVMRCVLRAMEGGR